MYSDRRQVRDARLAWSAAAGTRLRRAAGYSLCLAGSVLTGAWAVVEFCRLGTANGIQLMVLSLALLYVFFLPRVSERSLPRYLVLPATVVLTALTVFPIVYLANLSVREVTLANLRAAQPWAGLRNYLTVMRDPEVVASFFRTMEFLALAIGLELLLGMGMALLLFQEFKGKGFLTTLFMLPVMVSPILVGMMWRYMFSFNDGFLNQVVSALGLRRLPWLTNEPLPGLRLMTAHAAWAANTLNLNFGFLCIIVADVWQWTPFVALLLLAGLNSLPVEPFEAAMVDGASPWQVFRCVTLPLLRPCILVAVLIRLMDAMKVFDVIWALFEGAPFTRVLNLSLYTVGITRKMYGQGAALSIIIVAFVTLLAQAVLRVLERVQES